MHDHGKDGGLRQTWEKVWCERSVGDLRDRQRLVTSASLPTKISCLARTLLGAKHIVLHLILSFSLAIPFPLSKPHETILIHPLIGYQSGHHKTVQNPARSRGGTRRRGSSAYPTYPRLAPTTASLEHSGVDSTMRLIDFDAGDEWERRD